MIECGMRNQTNAVMFSSRKALCGMRSAEGRSIAQSVKEKNAML